MEAYFDRRFGNVTMGRVERNWSVAKVLSIAKRRPSGNGEEFSFPGIAPAKRHAAVTRVKPESSWFGRTVRVD